MIDISSEQPISFNQAAKFLPDGRRPGFTTWWRWSARGIRGVRLETILVGGRRCTTAEAVQRFFSAVTSAADGTPPPKRTSRERDAAIAHAEARCANAGA